MTRVLRSSWSVYAFILVGWVAVFMNSCGKTTPCIDPSKFGFPGNCPPIYNPVCGCDDRVYNNACQAEESGVQAWISGLCP